MGSMLELTAENMRRQATVAKQHRWDYVEQKINKGIVSYANDGLFHVVVSFTEAVPEDVLQELAQKLEQKGFTVSFAPLKFNNSGWSFEVSWE